LPTRRSTAGDHLSERLVHALAQLPRDVTLQLRADDPQRARLELLARAYGILDRIRFDDDAPPVPAGIPVAATMAELIDHMAPDAGAAPTGNGADDLFAGHRIAIVTNLPAHYRIPLFNGMQERLSGAGARLCVFFAGSDPAQRTYMRPGSFSFEHEFLRTRRAPLGLGDVPLGLERRLRRFDPTIVLAAGFAPGVAGRVARFAATRDVAFGVWSGELPTAATAGGRLRRMQREWILRRASFAVAYGSLAAEYLRTVAPRLPVVFGRNTAPAAALPPRPAGARPVEVLSVGQAIHRKGLDVLVDAFGLLTDLACNLTIVGGGPELDALRQRAEGMANVRFLGAVPSDEVREAYGSADVVAFPTRFDIFGLVLVEALGSGRATIVSPAAGAVADLCVTERNSLVVDGHEPQPWADAIRRLVVDAPLRTAIGDAGRRTIAGRWTVGHAIDAMIAGLRLGALARAQRASQAQQRLVIVGPLPPPYHGASVSTGLLVSSEILRRRFAVQHVDISDRRSGRANIGRWDLQNVTGGLGGAIRLLVMLRGRRGVVYLPIAQNAPAFLRDSLYIHAAALRRWKVAVHLRGSDFPDLYRAQPAAMRWYMRVTLRRVSTMGVMGESLRGLFDGLIAPERIAVVSNGTPEIELPDVPRDPLQVLFFSNLRRRKGLIESVDAALEVLREHPQARFVFVGDWESDELQRDVRARAREARDRLEFRPPATGDARLALLASSSMLLFPPVEPEGHPRVVLEALAAGLPVITTDRGAIAETVVDGESGFVLDHPVPHELAACVLCLLRDPHLCERMSRAARARYLERFTQEAADTTFADWIAGLSRR